MEIQKKLHVEGMMCSGCENRVNKAVSALDGVISCSASAAANEVCVSFDDARVQEAIIKQTIEDTGYDVVA